MVPAILFSRSTTNIWLVEAGSARLSSSGVGDEWHLRNSSVFWIRQHRAGMIMTFPERIGEEVPSFAIGAVVFGAVAAIVQRC